MDDTETLIRERFAIVLGNPDKYPLPDLIRSAMVDRLMIGPSYDAPDAVLDYWQSHYTPHWLMAVCRVLLERRPGMIFRPHTLTIAVPKPE